MANAATAENVNAAMRPPDFRYAVNQIRGGIEKKKDRISSINGEIGDLWSKIESKGVNKRGAKIFASLDKLEPAERMDVLRTINGCCDAAGWPENEGDLADRAEGTTVHMRVGGSGAAASNEDDDPAAGDENEEDESPAPAARLDGKAAMEAARERFANGGKRKELTPAYYQPAGDDADLARGPDVDD